MKKAIIFLLFTVLISAGFASEKKGLISVGVGGFDFSRDHHRTVEGRVEWKPGVEFLKFRPLVGLMATVNGSVYTYTGVSLCLKMQKIFFLEPNFAAGYYFHGGGKDLGYALEFRSGIEIGREFKDQSRIGIHFYHISNASLGRKNPGEESLVVFYAFPIEKLRSKKSRKSIGHN